MGNVDGSLFGTITESTLEVDDILSSPYPYEQQLVKILTGDIVIDAMSASDVLEHSDKVIKIEGYEKLNRTLFEVCKRLAKEYRHDGPVTCHLFISPAGGKSFPWHSDPDHVVLYVVEGCKDMAIENDQVYELLPGQALYIPQGTEHKTLNVKASKMLSFGLERFINEKL
ncbi:Cupin domain protein [compost metagenome]|jgi:mannose-6-phosphate isomerase-like protein (cupin superfamily)